jgi:hypothetical protein
MQLYYGEYEFVSKTLKIDTDRDYVPIYNLFFKILNVNTDKEEEVYIENEDFEKYFNSNESKFIKDYIKFIKKENEG